MPCLWGSHNNSQIFMAVGILDAANVNPASPPVSAAGMPAPAMFKALIDTGAQRTMISPSVVTNLNLVSIGKVPMQGIGPNVTYHDGYLFHVAFVVPILRAGQPFTVGGQAQAMVLYQPTPILGAELSIAGGTFDVLLGMDVISTGSLKIEGNGTYSFSI
jgi:hypothetical protein